MATATFLSERSSENRDLTGTLACRLKTPHAFKISYILERKRSFSLAPNETYPLLSYTPLAFDRTVSSATVMPFSVSSRRVAIMKASAVSAIAIASCTTMALVRWGKTFRPRLLYERTEFNKALLELCPSLEKAYHLPAFLHNGHVETIFAAWFRRRPHVLYEREIVHMPDGGMVALDREDPSAHPTDGGPLSSAPVVILLPGLTGGSEDTYIQHAVVHAREAGFRAVVFNPRGCSGSPVVTPQFYSASYTGDLRRVIDHVAASCPGVPIFAAGWSLGANILCRYLGEEKERTPLTAAVAMCNPFDLVLSDRNFRKGFNRIYDYNLARSLRQIYKDYHQLFEEAAEEGVKPFQPRKALFASTIREFDDAITRVSFDWPSVDAYYASSSSSLIIKDIKIPLLVVQVRESQGNG